MRWLLLLAVLVACQPPRGGASPSPRPVPQPPPVPAARPILGVVCHRMDSLDIALLRAMGVRHVRLSMYSNGQGAEWIDAALQNGFDVLVATYRMAPDRAADFARWPTVQWQIGNEPGWLAHTAQDVADSAAQGDVSPGLANGTPAAWIAAYSAAAPPLQILALHVYGDLLAGAGNAVAMAPATRRAWITEVGHRNPAQLAIGLQALARTRAERIYAYALTDSTEGYTLTPAHQQVIRDYLR